MGNNHIKCGMAHTHLERCNDEMLHAILTLHQKTDTHGTDMEWEYHEVGYRLFKTSVVENANGFRNGSLLEVVEEKHIGSVTRHVTEQKVGH